MRYLRPLWWWFYLLLLLLSCKQVDYRNSICQVWTFKRYRFRNTVICAKQGTGFLIAEDTVLTCAHVVSFGSPSFLHRLLADSVVCIFNSDTVCATICSTDYELDLTWLALKEPRHRPLQVAKANLTPTTAERFGSYLLVRGYPNAEWRCFPIRVIEPDTIKGKIVAMMDNHKSLGGASGSPIFYNHYVIGILQEQGRGGYTHKRFIRFRLLK